MRTNFTDRKYQEDQVLVNFSGDRKETFRVSFFSLERLLILFENISYFITILTFFFNLIISSSLLLRMVKELVLNSPHYYETMCMPLSSGNLYKKY